MSLDPLKCTFLAYYISALRGCCTLKFLHALDIDQGYLAHTPTGMGVPPQKKINRENLKVGLKFSIYTSISSELMGISSQIFIQTTCREPEVIIWVQFLEGCLLKFGSAKKTVQIFSRFLSTFDFDFEYPRSGSTNQKSKKQLINYDPSHVGLKKVFELWSTNEKVIDVSGTDPP